MSKQESDLFYDPTEDDETGSPIVEALNRFARTFPQLHDPAETEAFMKSVEGLPDAAERVERFMQEIIARYETWARENGVEWS
jgi:broad specificity phosphatase PhoE